MNTRGIGKMFLYFIAGALFFFCQAGGGALAAEDLQAICVPWMATESGGDNRHYTYDGAEITLMGIARGPAKEYMWDFGDGTETPWMPIGDPYNLGEKHTYTGIPLKPYTAILYVKDDQGFTSHDLYRLRIYVSTDLHDEDHLQVRVNMAIDEGLWYLHTTLMRNTYGPGAPGYDQPYGYWNDPGGTEYILGATGTAVDAFQMAGHRPNMPYDFDPYVETVQRGLNYLLTHTYVYDIDMEPAGDPDWNGNGKGLVINWTDDLYDGRQTYLGGICMITVASTMAPGYEAQVGGDFVYKRELWEIAQDLVEFFAWGQVDTGPDRGGWRYHANFGEADMSTTQWPPLAMLAAELKEGMNAHVPEFVRPELEIYLDNMQNKNKNNDHGGFAYNQSNNWYNCTKTAAGIICHEFIDIVGAMADSRVLGAAGFLYRHWNDTGSSWEYTKLHGNSYGMYGVMKAFRIPTPDVFDVHDYDYNNDVQKPEHINWFFTPLDQHPTYKGLATYICETQQADGSWDDVVGSNQVKDAFCTGWRVLTLLPGVVNLSPVAVITNASKLEFDLSQDIPLDGSESFHLDRYRNIVKWEWDLDYDINQKGFDIDRTGESIIIDGGFPNEDEYGIALRVWDDNPDGSQSDIESALIWVHPPPPSSCRRCRWTLHRLAEYSRATGWIGNHGSEWGYREVRVGSRQR